MKSSARVHKIKTVRGRIAGYKATFGPIESESPVATPAAATESCEVNVLAALSRLYQGGRVLHWRGHMAVIMPTIAGWSYWIDTFSRDGYCSQLPASKSREDAENAALHHLAQIVWTLDVKDDEAFLGAEPSTEEAGLPYIVRDELRPWIFWQRDYARLRAEGLSDTEAHAKARRSA